MPNEGRHVLAPIATNNSDDREMEDLYDGNSIFSDELDVAAHEVVETENLAPIKETSVADGNSRHLEEMTNNLTEKRTSEPSTLGKTSDSVRYDSDPSLGTGLSDRGSNIRWELIPKFPKDIPSNKLWENWQGFIENFELATSLSTFTRSTDRAKLLYLSIGKNLQDIINAANLQPNYQDPRCYSTLVDGINTYFKSMTDTAAEHEAFQSMRQVKGESIIAFHARLTQRVRLCGYSPTDQTRFVLAQLLKGMQNREIAVTARTYGHEASYIVRAATRVEAYKADEEITEPRTTEPRFVEVHAINRKRASNSESQPTTFRKPRKIEEFGGADMKKSKASFQEYRQGRRNHCWRCGFTFHKGPKCPALERPCNSCGRVGHFASKCRNDSNKNRINNVQEEEPRKMEPHGWKMHSSEDQV